MEAYISFRSLKSLRRIQLFKAFEHKRSRASFGVHLIQRWLISIIAIVGALSFVKLCFLFVFVCPATLCGTQLNFEDAQRIPLERSHENPTIEKILHAKSNLVMIVAFSKQDSTAQFLQSFCEPMVTLGFICQTIEVSWTMQGVTAINSLLSDDAEHVIFSDTKAVPLLSMKETDHHFVISNECPRDLLHQLTQQLHLIMPKAARDACLKSVKKPAILQKEQFIHGLDGFVPRNIEMRSSSVGRKVLVDILFQTLGISSTWESALFIGVRDISLLDNHINTKEVGKVVKKDFQNTYVFVVSDSRSGLSIHTNHEKFMIILAPRTIFARFQTFGVFYAVIYRGSFLHELMHSFHNRIKVVYLGGDANQCYGLSNCCVISLLHEMLKCPKTSPSMNRLSHRIHMRNRFSARKFAFEVLGFVNLTIPKVCVVVPNYNYARFLPERLLSIAHQTLPYFELFVVDDSSQDESLQVLQDLHHKIDFTIHKKASNVKSVWNTWLTGSKLCNSDFIWIAEADDAADSRFLEKAVKPLLTNGVSMSYTQSKPVDESTIDILPSYAEYTTHGIANPPFTNERWMHRFAATKNEELCNGLAVKNTIPNVSGIVFNLHVFLDKLESLLPILRTFNIAGDWILFVNILDAGKIAYHPEVLNFHRKHSASVSAIERSQEDHLAEILTAQNYIIKCHLSKDRMEEVMILANEYVETLYVSHFKLGQGSPCIDRRFSHFYDAHCDRYIQTVC